MARDEIHKGDTPTFLVTIKDENDNVLNISSATTKQLWFRKPGDTVVIKSAAFYTDGTDGKLVYTAVITDLDEVGDWGIQGYVVIAAGTFHSDIKEFEVFRNLNDN